MIVVGIDGASTETLLAPARRGALPNVGSLLEAGAGGTLWSVSTSSAAAWTSHLTGVKPETHGVEGFVRDDRFVRTSDVAVRSYPELLDARGERVGLLNFPITYPGLDLKNGYSVPGQLTPVDEDVTCGNDAVDGILDDVEYEVDIRYGDRQYSFVDPDLDVSPDTVLEDVHRVEGKRLAAAERALAETEWDLFLVQVNGTDPMQHVLWDEMADARLEDTGMLCVYELVDEFVGHVRETYPDEPLLLFSDHGFRLDVWGQDERARRRWRSLRGLAGRLLPESLKQTRLRQFGVDLLAGGARLTGGAGGVQNPGSHDPAGVWVAGGGSFQPRAGETTAQFLDLPPTILHAMGHPVPEAYPGSVLTEALDIGRRVERKPVELAVDRTPSVTDDRAEQLAHLGYVKMVEGDEPS